MKIEIAGIKLLFIFENAERDFRAETEARYGGFFYQTGKPVFVIKTLFKKLKKNPFLPTVKEASGNLEISRGDFFFKALKTGGPAELIITPSIYSLDSFLRILISLLLPEKNGFLLHASSIFEKNRALVFAGKSGAGKTTVAALAKKNHFIMTDELTPLTVKKKVFIYSSPFWGEMKGKGKNLKAAAGGIYMLKKAHSNNLKTLTAAEFTKALLPCVMNFSSSAEKTGKILDAAISLYKKTSPKTLFFSKESPAFLKLL